MQEAKDLVLKNPAKRELAARILPSIIERAGDAARFTWEEFFSGQVANLHTRKAYLHAVRQFLAWVERHGRELPQITPGMVGQYLGELPLSAPSKKLHLAALRRFFDALTIRHVVVLNPAHSVRTERYSQVEGLTPEITVEQARRLLHSIEPARPIDFRDKALIAVLIYTAARAGAVAKLRVKDFGDDPGAPTLRLFEKNGKARVLPVRYDLRGWLSDCVLMTPPEQRTPDSPLFRTIARDGRFSARAMTGIDICRMVKKRLRAAGLSTAMSPHSFRACTATDLLLQGLPLEAVQALLGHADTRTTKLYDRRERTITRNIVERISV